MIALSDLRPRMRVEFDDAIEGTVTGALMGTIPMCSCNPHAAVVLANDELLSGVIWCVPIIELREEPLRWRRIKRRNEILSAEIVVRFLPAFPAKNPCADPDAPGNVVTILDND